MPTLAKLNDRLRGLKVYLAAAGLFGLALYQLSTEQYADAVQTFTVACAAAGLRAHVGAAPAKAPPPPAA